MKTRAVITGVVVAAVALVATVHGAATVSRQQADAFARKITLIRQQGESASVKTGTKAVSRRTPVTESELNSWFAYHAQPLLPDGLTKPTLTIIGNGRVAGEATVDLDAISKRRQSGGTFDPWNLVTGRLPITVSGILHTRDGRGRFELQSAELSGIPVPKTLLQELVSYYSTSADKPGGVRLDDTFELPANIRQIEVGAGQAVVIQ